MCIRDRKLTGGAKAVIGYQLFKDDAGASGATIDMEFRVSGLTDQMCIRDSFGPEPLGKH